MKVKILWVLWILISTACTSDEIVKGLSAIGDIASPVVDQTLQQQLESRENVHLINKASGYCLDTDGKAEEYAEVRMYRCVDHPNQTWDIERIYDKYRLINKASGYCLDTDGKAEEYAKVRMYRCVDHPNQTWNIERIRDKYRLINKSSGYCLDTDGKAEEYAKVRMYRCVDHPNQTWDIQ